MTSEEKDARAQILEAEIALDALLLNPCKLDLRWDKFRKIRLEEHIGRLKSRILLARIDSKLQEMT